MIVQHRVCHRRALVKKVLEVHRDDVVHPDALDVLVVLEPGIGERDGGDVVGRAVTHVDGDVPQVQVAGAGKFDIGVVRDDGQQSVVDGAVYGNRPSATLDGIGGSGLGIGPDIRPAIAVQRRDG